MSKQATCGTAGTPSVSPDGRYRLGHVGRIYREQFLELGNYLREDLDRFAVKAPAMHDSVPDRRRRSIVAHPSHPLQHYTQRC